MQAFLDENKILFRFQSRFRKHFSTDLCLSYLNNKIATGFESGLHTGMVLIDLQKALDTINHKILINKMEFLGFSKNVIVWFKSYLSHRKFKVNLNKSFSEPGKLLCGVPQGSILRQLVFLLYINDMPQAVKCELLLYTDDTCFNTVTLMKLKSSLIRTLVRYVIGLWTINLASILVKIKQVNSF